MIVLNGASCTGKTTLAKELATDLALCRSKPIFRKSFDDFVMKASDDPEYMEIESQRLHLRKEEIPASGIPRMFCIFHNQLLEELNIGRTLVVDHCFTNDEGYKNFLKVFEEYGNKIALIKVFCTHEAAQQRLQQRNKCSDRTQHRYSRFVDQHFTTLRDTIYENKEYRGEVDTTLISPKEGALEVMDILDINHDRKNNESVAIFF